MEKQTEKIIVISICIGLITILSIIMSYNNHNEIYGMIAVGLLWGCTNVFMKKGISFPEHDQTKNFFTNLLQDLKFLIINWKFILPFGINQLGSVLFTVLLGNNDFSLIVPISNALTFLFTFLTAYLMGENTLSTSLFLSLFFFFVSH